LSVPARRIPSVPELRSMIARLLLVPIVRPAFVFAWSWWRQCHQAFAAEAHRRTRNNHNVQL